MICFPLDPKVEVIYVSPVELNDEVYQYYSKLLGMKAQRLRRYETGNEDDDGDDEEGEDIENRYKIIVPDAVERFPVSLIPDNIARQLGCAPNLIYFCRFHVLV